ncbi:helix-turn-helix domain-containing protein [Spirosoma pollinicola]|uniref:helix-turn-helix domain-containing protein n=1 Tax=Spirosoma pollinicola TaxID=2057025 RepID=UPI001F0C7ED5|nr:helix-turn-helix domain-containing protein [Spirosoma pollinicola]
MIEQAVIVYDGNGALTLGRPLINTWISQNLNVDEPHLAPTQFNPPADSDPQTQSAVKHHHDEKERDTILAVLKKTNGKIREKGGAAELLNIKPNTLEYRMGKLGIKK